MAKCRLELEGRLYDFDRPDFNSEGYMVYPRVFVCPVCLVQWGKIHLEGHRVYCVETGSCKECGWKTFLRPVPASILTYAIGASGLDLDLLDYVPKEVVHRELLLTLEAMK